MWEQCWQEACQRQEAGERKSWPLMMGYDADTSALRAAEKNIHAAGVSQFITLEQRELAQLPHKPAAFGLLITNGVSPGHAHKTALSDDGNRMLMYFSP